MAVTAFKPQEECWLCIGDPEGLLLPSRCVLFEMLAGQQAFDAPDLPGLMAKILAGAHQQTPLHSSDQLQVGLQGQASVYIQHDRVKFLCKVSV